MKGTIVIGRAGFWIAFLLASPACVPQGPIQPLPPMPNAFVNFETPHVSPLATTPDGNLLLAVNTADNRLEVFDLTGDSPVHVGSIPVGLDPVSVRARTENEAWVVNHLSDSVSIVDLAARNVVRTLRTADEPADVVFAASRAFITCSQANQVYVFHLEDLSGQATVLTIEGEDPRALALSPDGSQIYTAIFESGNNTTMVGPDAASAVDSPYGGQWPAPNSGDIFSPPLTEGLPPVPIVAQIVKKDLPTGRWLDDNNYDWSAKVGWDLHDHDLAVIDAHTLTVSYVTGLMNLNMQLSVRPDGQVTVIGTEAMNHIRFEPNLTGRFVHSVGAFVQPANQQKQIVELNPHLATAYEQGIGTVSQAERDLSLADPRGIAWDSDGTIGYITGMGSNNLVMIDANGTRLGQIEVGQGPTGLVLDESRQRLYVLNKFDATISTIETAGHTESSRTAMYDPTPAAIIAGRPMLYDAHKTSGLGVTACASCHIDARMDPLAWDLGNPAGQVKTFNQTCNNLDGFVLENCEDFHPMKGPMVTQTLQGIIGLEPLHWRGDREDLAAFNPAFQSLLGDDQLLTDDEMAKFTAFLATLQFPPNPNRNLDNSLRDWVERGNPKSGEFHFSNNFHDSERFNCVKCHAFPNGTDRSIITKERLDRSQDLKVPHLRNVYEKTGFYKGEKPSSRGFGITHAGFFRDMVEFLNFRVFHFPKGEIGEQERRDLEAFILSFDTGTHAGVGRQVTLNGANHDDADLNSLIDLMVNLADRGQVGLVIKGRQQGVHRGYAYIGGSLFQSDRASEQADVTTLRTAATADNELTWTLVPFGSETRIGIDRDQDGYFDLDEIENGSDPADPTINPTP